MSAKVPETQEVVAHIDGGSRGNPGPAAYAVVVRNAQGSRLAAFARFLGQATNNVAEYQGLLAALQHALENQYSRFKVVSDSELLARQITGQYKVKNPDLKILHARAKALIEQFDSFTIKHVLREHNREADRLVDEALDAAEHKRKTPQAGSSDSKPFRTTATYHQGVLDLRDSLPIAEGEQVDLKIQRKK